MIEKKRLELIIEKMALKRACRVLDDAGVKGYTIVPAIAGRGTNTKWNADTDFSDSSEMVVIIAIGHDDLISLALEKLDNVLNTHIGVVNVSTTWVRRGERF